ncbi:hypothetical protein F3J23_16000 [Chryseobacterium sp. Tr-659]|uniref:hypothetical protein n=1 Tax=Chryseobacterium sp. Tr-659 TaxID=2608340 RepID=UPI001423E2B8|nr:hypothetical protein [Chryseobacterium sp. Tr-659]NIF06946.1 hypothetical protein [Chryseobacterium sp. Tr-659]
MSIKEISKRMVLAKLNSLNKKTMLKDVPKEYTDVAVKRLNNLKQELLSSPKENYTEDELLLIIDKASETDHDKIRLEMNQ